MLINELTGIVVDSCIKIHKKIGPGCYENTYEKILAHELMNRGIKVDRQLHFPIQYEDLFIPNAYKLDMLVDDRLVLELKSVNPVPSVFFNQLSTYLGLTELKHGMLLNFKEVKMIDGIHRLFNNSGNEYLEKQE